MAHARVVVVPSSSSLLALGRGRTQNSATHQPGYVARVVAARAFDAPTRARRCDAFDGSSARAISRASSMPTSSRRGVVTRLATTAKSAEESSTANANGDAVVIGAKVRDVVAMISNSDGGMKMKAEERAEVDGLLEDLGRDGLKRAVNPNDDAKIFGYYDVSYVSVGPNQVGQPAGGRFRSPLGRFLFKTIGLEQNLFEPNKIENRVAFTLFGCLPGEVTLEGTFAPLEGKDDGRTVEACFGPPGISIAGGPKLRIGPKSKVVLSTTYLDDDVRIGKGSRGSLFVFKRKSAEQAARDQRRWGVGGVAIAVMLITAIGLGVYGVQQLQVAKNVLHSCGVIAASALSLAMAYILRDGGIVAEDADLDDGTVLELTVEQQAFLSKGRSDGGTKGENVFNI